MMDPPCNGPKLEVRKSPGSTLVEMPRELKLDEQGRVYGSRWVEVRDADGAARFEEVPLTWKDLFDPQEGDRLMHSPGHGKTLRDTGARLDCFYDAQGRDDVVVYDDVRIDWKTPGVDPACPDVAVIPGMKKRHKGRRPPKSFNEKEEGTSPCFVLEVTSEETANYDRTRKPAIYRKAKVPEIFLLDELKSPWELVGERRNPKTGRYLKVRPDKRGRLLAETLGVYWSISESGDDLILEDAETGEVLLKPVAEAQARRQEAEAREAAERQAAEDAEARRQAEVRVEQEAEARRLAEERVEKSLRRGVEDLCVVLGLAWDAERRAQVGSMSAPQLEALRAHLVSQKSWPESFSDASM